MGCIESREKKSYEKILEEIDEQLKFSSLSLEAIKTVFNY